MDCIVEALKRMHRIPRNRKLTFHPQGISPVNPIPSMDSDHLGEDNLTLRPHIGPEMIRAFLFANQMYRNFPDDETAVLNDVELVRFAGHER